MIKIIKITLGSIFSIWIAEYLHLDFSTAAGIIALLSIQDTKKKTIQLSLQRILAFVIATMIAFVCFHLFGFHAVAFGIFIFFFAWVCDIMHLHESIAMNGVLVTHYLVMENIDYPLIWNEFLLLLIGVFIGTIFNLYMPNDIKKIRKIQFTLEQDMKIILQNLAECIQIEAKSSRNLSHFHDLNEHLEDGMHLAYSHMNNRFLQETQYFISYMEMRKQQMQVLYNVNDKIQSIYSNMEQASKISELLLHISSRLMEQNNAESLLMEVDKLYELFRKQSLPDTRNEFETRAILFLILKDLEYFLILKKNFVSSLSDKQKAQYWTS